MIPKWLHILSYPLRAEFGWMLPKSDSQLRRESLGNEYYNKYHTFEEKQALREDIEREFPDFFSSDHYKR